MTELPRVEFLRDMVMLFSLSELVEGVELLKEASRFP